CPRGRRPPTAVGRAGGGGRRRQRRVRSGANGGTWPGPRGAVFSTAFGRGVACRRTMGLMAGATAMAEPAEVAPLRTAAVPHHAWWREILAGPVLALQFLTAVPI